MPQVGASKSLYTAGTSTALTGEAMSQQSGQTYHVTDEDKRILDPETEVVVYDNAVEVSAADIETIDYLLGRVTFDSGYVVTGPVTLDGAYLPKLRFAEAIGVSMELSRAKLVTTPFQPDAATPVEKSIAGVRMLTGSIESLDPMLMTDLDGGAGERIIADVIRDETPVIFYDEDEGMVAFVRLYSASKRGDTAGLLSGSFTFEAVVIPGANAGYEASVSFES